MIKDVIRLKWQADLSHEQIALSLNISKGAVTKYLSLMSVSLQSVIFELSIGKRYLQYVTKQIPAGQLRSRTDGPAPVARCAVNNFVIQ
jgi:hypothetical protein